MVPTTEDSAQLPSGPTATRDGFTQVLAAFLFGLAVAGIAAFALMWLLRSPGRTIDVSRVTVVTQIQQLARLETVMFSMDKIVAGGQESRFLPQFLVGDRLLLTAYGEVTAGVDLRQLSDENVEISARQVRLELPPAEIFSSRIDNARTRVYSRQTGLFSAVDPELESEVRREAERQIQQAALDNHILDLATANARTTLQALLRGLGLEQVEFR